jgi:hypothetical protein
MLPQDSVKRLEEHSGVSLPRPPLQGLAFFDQMQAIKNGESAPYLEESVADIIRCLQCLNESGAGQQDPSLQLACAFSRMNSLAVEAALSLCKTGKDCRKVLMAAWKISCAWDAYLAGDIEDIPQELKYEAAAKNLD